MIHLMLTLKFPLIISEYRIDNLLISTDYISGSALRGALANAFLKSSFKDNKNLFRDIFLSGNVRFGNSYLGTEQVSILPATARSCKNFPGFFPDKPDKDDPKHRVVDGLIRYHAFHESLCLNCEDKEYLKHLDECEECGSPIEQFAGAYGIKGDKYEKFESHRTVITRTALNEHTLTAKEGSLFSTELIMPPSETEGLAFHGRIFVSDSILEEAVKDCLEALPLTIGGERTYGHGQVEVTEAAIIPNPVFPDTDIETRFNNFNNKMKEFLSDKQEFYFALTLNSDAILVDRFLRFVSLLNKNILYDYFSTDLTFELVDSYCSTRIVQGWSNIHRLPKENDLAIVKGSTFLYKAKGGTDKQRFINYLTHIETNGIGDRKAEGFGEVIVCHPFHLEVNPI